MQLWPYYFRSIISKWLSTRITISTTRTRPTASTPPRLLTITTLCLMTGTVTSIMGAMELIVRGVSVQVHFPTSLIYLRFAVYYATLQSVVTDRYDWHVTFDNRDNLFLFIGFCHTCEVFANTQILFCLQTWWWWCISMVDTMRLSYLTFGESQLWEGLLAPWLVASSWVFCVRGSSSSECSYSAMKWGKIIM